ncbi:MAG TPA: hypothetical protein VF139_06730 [Candidatus Polarisedimenticolaceae bacterium]
MPDDKPLKSAFELAMERLEAKDREEGVEASGPLTEAQKDEIARLRRDATAKLAEMEILHRQNLAKAGGDPAELAKAEENYRVDRSRVEDRLETAIRKVRGGK